MNISELKRIYLFYFSHLVNRPLAKPDYVGILVSKRCNLRCKMCDIYKHPTSPEDELSFNKIKEIIDDIAKWGVRTITLTGGEPFLRKDFFKIAEYAMNKVAHTAINTNLTLINREMAEKICNLPYHKFHLEVSLDGAISTTHDSIRGIPGTFNKIMDAVRLIREISKEKDTDVSIGTTFVLMEENVREIMALIKIAEDLKFVNVSLMPMLKSNVNLKKRSDRPCMGEENLKILDREIERLIDYKKGKGLLINPIESLKHYGKYFRGELSIKGMCNAGYMGPNIVEDGEVFICTHSIGNIKENCIREIWYSKKANHVRVLTERCLKPCLQHYSIRFHETNPVLATYSYIKKKLNKK